MKLETIRDFTPWLSQTNWAFNQEELRNRCEHFSLVDFHEPKRYIFFSGGARDPNRDFEKSPKYKPRVF